MSGINETLVLPSGMTLKNRLVKAPTTETLGDSLNRATPGHVNLYKGWAEDSDVGMIITGNMMVDRRFMELPSNIAIDLDYGDQTEDQMSRLKALAEAGQSNGAKIIAQLTHGGGCSSPMVAKVAIAGGPAKATDQAAATEEATEEQLERAKEKFIYAAKVCEEAGFNGVEIHSGRGYLFATLASAKVNKRTDRFGGDFKARTSLFFETLRAVKANAGEGFTVAVKVSSTDFQYEELTIDDAVTFVLMLADEGVDFIELAGGSNERTGAEHGSTKNRDDYFDEFVAKIKEAVKSEGKAVRLMSTGGFRSKSVMNKAIEEGIDLIGIARPICFDSFCPKKLLDGDIDVLPKVEETWGLPMFLGWSFFQRFKAIRGLTDAGMVMIFFKKFHEIAEGKTLELTETKHPNMLSALSAFLKGEKKRAHELEGFIQDDYYLQPYIKTREEKI